MMQSYGFVLLNERKEIEMDIVTQLKEFEPKHNFFIGVDSDGCAFDAMGIKHTKVFIPIAVDIWGLQAIEKEFYEVEEFVNLYSSLRGVNRFPGLLLTFEYLEEKFAAENRALSLPDYSPLKEFVDSGLPMSNTSLEKFSEGKNCEFLAQVMEWSKRGDRLFSELTKDLPPFKYVKESLEKASKEADTMIVSAASTAGLMKDWGEAGILQYMTLVAGQEAGGKKEQLQYAVTGKYEANHILMVGDAPGDMKAAKANNALFYPINPAHEEESWERFYNEAYQRFISGTYAGEYEEQLITEFLKLLPEEKPWAK